MVLVPFQAMGFWGTLLFLIFLEPSWGQEQTYIISTPIVFRVGAPENVTVQAYGYTEAFDTTISVKSYPDKNVNYSSGTVELSPENKFQNSAILTIQAQELSEGQNWFSNVYLEVVSKHFSKLEIMPIVYDNSSLFVHTDKPVYTPEQPVKVAVYSVDDDLEPVTRATVLTFIDPEGSEVGIIEGSNGTGIASFPDFEIPSNPKLGRWTIKANYREDASTTGTTHFEVKGHEKAFKMAVMPTTDLQHKMEKQASKYKHPVIKKCCYDGARYNEHETCVQRAARVTIGPNCVKAFSICCEIAHQMTFKRIQMSSHHNRA